MPLSLAIAYTLNGQERVLRTTVAFLFDPEFLLPEAVVDELDEQIASEVVFS